MPIPPPEPPVKRYHLAFRSQTPVLELTPTGELCYWSDVEALLLQRAQEIAELQKREARLHEIVADINSVCELPDDLREQVNAVLGATDADGHCGNPICQRISDLEQQLTARAQEIEQVKAALIEADRWFDGWCPTATCCAASGEGVHEQIRAALKADAALVSRAPQQEQEP